MRAAYVIGLIGMAALAVACDPGAFDRLTRGEPRGDSGVDAGAADAGALDASAGDAGASDAGALDASASDAGALDAGDDAGNEPPNCEALDAMCCDDVACEGACTPDATQCASITEQQTCDEDGQWGAASVCQFACVGQACGGECVPFTRTCIDNAPNECSSSGVWQPQAACSAGNPVCVGAGVCGCRPGAVRCGGDGTQPQVCSEINEWADAGVPCANCTAGRCPAEGCSDARRSECELAGGCHCVNNECSGGFCSAGDGCTDARRWACGALGCGCVDGGCSGGKCEGNGCTARKNYLCDEGGCGCSLQSCTGSVTCEGSD